MNGELVKSGTSFQIGKVDTLSYFTCNFISVVINVKLADLTKLEVIPYSTETTDFMISVSLFVVMESLFVVMGGDFRGQILIGPKQSRGMIRLRVKDLVTVPLATKQVISLAAPEFMLTGMPP